MLKTYHKPELVQYGRIGELTLGAGGTEPDFNLVGTAIVSVANNDCSAQLPATSCNVPSSS
jgi:hypothetical protein